MKRFFFFVLALGFVFLGVPFVGIATPFLLGIQKGRIPYEIIIIAFFADMLAPIEFSFFSLPLPLYSTSASIIILVSFFIHKQVSSYV